MSAADQKVAFARSEKRRQKIVRHRSRHNVMEIVDDDAAAWRPLRFFTKKDRNECLDFILRNLHET